MIDPTDVTKLNRSVSELQEFLLFCVSVAGKTASQINKALECFLDKGKAYLVLWEVPPDTDSGYSPFEIIRRIDGGGYFDECLFQSKLGQHEKIRRAFKSLAFGKLDLKTCSVADLEAIHGIGPKTSRYFILHSRENPNVACLDTHQLKYLRSQGYNPPKILNAANYTKWEKIWLDHVRELGITDVAKFDLQIWNMYSKRSGKDM